MPISLHSIMKRERVKVAHRLEKQRRAAQCLEKLIQANHKYGSRPWWPTVEARGRVKL